MNQAGFMGLNAVQFYCVTVLMIVVKTWTIDTLSEDDVEMYNKLTSPAVKRLGQ